MDTNESLRCFKKKSSNFDNFLNQAESDSQENDEYENERIFNNEKQNIDLIIEQPTEKKPVPSRFRIYWKRYRYFIDSPRVHFFYETLFYSIFLGLFSYMLLCDFEYYENKTDLFLNITENYTNYSKIEHLKKPAFSEYLIIFWVLMYLIEEFRQVMILDLFLIYYYKIFLVHF